jgi:anthranilate synthase component I
VIFPKRKEFEKLVKKGNLIPVFCDVIADMETPVSAYYKICNQKSSDTFAFLLESIEGGENIARYSFLGINPNSIFIQKDGKSEHIIGTEKIPINGCDVFDKINSVLKKYKPVSIPGLPPFIGGAVGYASYDIISEIEKTVESPEASPYDLPEAFFMITDTVLAFDRVKHTIKVISQAYLGDDDDITKVYNTTVEKINKIVKLLKIPTVIPPVTINENAQADANVDYLSNKTREEFYGMVNKTKQYIYDGDIIQAVLSQRFSIDSKVSPIALYRALRMINPSPYMFLLNCGDFSVVGASPEVHAKCINRKITVRPIAGTRKRGDTEEVDLALEKELLDDPKERAEHIMLVDLARNDVGRIAEAGSVKVNQLMTVEKYSHVMHIVSTINGILDKKYESDHVMRSTFPAGTLSGAPKVRAMQIISEQEKEKRGPYGGVVAYYSFDGNIDSCITIRTAVIKNNKVFIQAGAGIVADSDPITEYEETQNKAKALIKAVSLANFFD